MEKMGLKNNSYNIQVLSTQAFEPSCVSHDHVHCPLSEKVLVQAVVGDLGDGNSTAKGYVRLDHSSNVWEVFAYEGY